MKYFCNPVNINYRYQFNADPRKPKMQICREAADPSMICFQGKYYIFASMTLSVWVSEDLVHWESHRLPENLPLYDYAPDVRVLGEYVYFSASKRGENCNFYRTKDILNGPYEEITGSFDFWDPNLFCDDNGRVYFYWGCSNATPLWGVELDPKTMHPLGERKALIEGDAWSKGYERVGEDHCKYPKSEEEVDVALEGFLKMQGSEARAQVTEEYLPLIRGMLSDKPYIEGAWMDKYQGKYYLQYACSGTQYNIYSDGVYIGDSPLGPFIPADNNPYSYKPGGFLPGAGHGSTMWDKEGNLWHTATMRISKNHDFERRVGIWPAGFDADGELFCNQRYGDWPMEIEDGRINPWKAPKWYLLSYGKPATASSSEEGKEPELATDENVQTWWRAATAESGEWLQVDLEKEYTVNAIQINFADDAIDIPVPGQIRGTTQARYIEEKDYVTRWKLEGSLDGEHYFVIEDKSEVATDLSHDLIVREEGVRVRFLKLTVLEVPYGQQPCISGVRVFGVGDGEKPKTPEFEAVRENDLDMMVKVTNGDAVGYNILWGSSPEKLYHSYMIFGNAQRVGALVKGKEYYVRVDAFNENGITEGNTVKLSSGYDNP
ncbi:MAG: family 43 glycosylhydrolase [Lachnospiraceae bacterium]|nr:family 43 glycosylhydrolase [Lachnospiraceae bacterium]